MTETSMQVWPVIHSKLVKRGLKSVPAEEVRSMHLSRSVPYLWHCISAAALDV